MPDMTDAERAAMNACLAPLGDYVATLGMQRPLADYRREEVLAFIHVVIDAYRTQIIAEFERLVQKERAFFEQQRKPSLKRTGGVH